jgi:hypothetical protein
VFVCECPDSKVLTGLRGSRADAGKLRRLEQALSQARGEFLQAGRRVLQLERRERETMGAYVVT